MSLEEFRQFAETWGGDIDRWPLKARQDARRLAATNEGRSILKREQSLDQNLSTFADANFIVLEAMRRDEDGLSIYRKLRALSRAPILLLSASKEDIVGITISGDEPRPLNRGELGTRILALMRPARPGERRLKFGELTANLTRRTVIDASNRLIELTSTEFDLLECFVTRPGRVLSRDELMDWTRGRRFGPFDRAIDVQISRLRKKLDRGVPSMFRTIRNLGYMLVVPVEECL